MACMPADRRSYRTALQRASFRHGPWSSVYEVPHICMARRCSAACRLNGFEPLELTVRNAITGTDIFRCCLPDGGPLGRFHELRRALLLTLREGGGAVDHLPMLTDADRLVFVKGRRKLPSSGNMFRSGVRSGDTLDVVIS